MKIRALKSFYGDGETTNPGDIIEVRHTRGRALVAKKYAVEVGEGPVVPQAATKEHADSAPFPERQAGGQTGEEKPQSASQQGRPRRKRRSTSQEGDAES